MKKFASWAIMLCFLVSGIAFAETKDETMLKKVPSMGVTFNDSAKNIKKYEDLLKEIEKETAVLKKNYLGIEEGKEMTQQEAMARYGGMGQQMGMAEIQLISSIQEASTYLNTEFIQYIGNMGSQMQKIDAEMQAELDKVRGIYEEQFSKINDGEGSTAADVNKWEKVNSDYMASQLKVVDKYMPKKKKLMDEYKANLTTVVTKAAPAYSKAFTSTKNNTVLIQAASLRMNILSSISTYIEQQTSFLKWKPENRSRK